MPHLWAESAIRLVSFECFLSGVVILALFYFYTTDERTVWPVFAAFMIVTFAIPAAFGAGLWCFRAWAHWGTALWLSLGACAPRLVDMARVAATPVGSLDLASGLLDPRFPVLQVCGCRLSQLISNRSQEYPPGLHRPRKLALTVALVEAAILVVAIIWGAAAFSRP